MFYIFLRCDAENVLKMFLMYSFSINHTAVTRKAIKVLALMLLKFNAGFVTIINENCSLLQTETCIMHGIRKLLLTRYKKYALKYLG